MGEPDFDKMSPEEIAEYNKQTCVFCKIIKGEIPSRKAFEDDKLLCIMDIYPAGKGHLLMMTKEHYPFLPVIPPPLAAHMFRVTKDLSKAAKAAVVTDSSTIFIANGGIAGQQSPHFLYHIIPREKGDGLDNFHIPAIDAHHGSADSLAPLIKQRIASIINPVQRPLAAQKPAPSPQKAPMVPAAGEEKTKQLAEFIIDHPEIMDLLAKHPDTFMKEVESRPDLKKMFEGVNIEMLSQFLKQMEG